MAIDVPSVIAVSALVTAVVGALLLYSWRQSRVKALLWWGAADLLVAWGTAVPLASAIIADGPFIEIANAAVLLGYGLTWGGLREFEGRPTRLTWAACGSVLWLVASQFPSFEHGTWLRAALSFLLSGCYVTAAALVVARGRTEPLVSRNAAIFLLSIHSVILIGRVAESAFAHWPNDRVLSPSQLFAAFSLENLLFTVAMAFILLAMMKERLEAQQKSKAYTDPLTDLPNRRAFFEKGGELVAETAKAAVPSSMILVDLDHFKQINDTYGHGLGDLALVAFARTARSEIRTKDLLARIGGEEFACLLPGLSVEEAVSTAERIRLAVGRQVVEASDHSFSVTVSAGVSVSPASDVTLDVMLGAADKALYEAKRLGRNRVEQNRISLICRDGELTVDAGSTPGSVVRKFRKRA